MCRGKIRTPAFDARFESLLFQNANISYVLNFSNCGSMCGATAEVESTSRIAIRRETTFMRRRSFAVTLPPSALPCVENENGMDHITTAYLDACAMPGCSRHPRDRPPGSQVAHVMLTGSAPWPRDYSRFTPRVSSTRHASPTIRDASLSCITITRKRTFLLHTRHSSPDKKGVSCTQPLAKDYVLHALWKSITVARLC